MAFVFASWLDDRRRSTEILYDFDHLHPGADSPLSDVISSPLVSRETLEAGDGRSAMDTED